MTVAATEFALSEDSFFDASQIVGDRADDRKLQEAGSEVASVSTVGGASSKTKGTQAYRRKKKFMVEGQDACTQPVHTVSHTSIGIQTNETPQSSFKLPVAPSHEQQIQVLCERLAWEKRLRKEAKLREIAARVKLALLRRHVGRAVCSAAGLSSDEDESDLHTMAMANNVTCDSSSDDEESSEEEGCDDSDEESSYTEHL